MAKQIKIKEIAQMAGVSAGTVDRILHGRGNVSPAKQQAVEQVLNRVGYRANIHTSAVSLKRGYRFVVTVPTIGEGSYWESILGGIKRALEEYSDIQIQLDYCYYDQFDETSCAYSFSTVLSHEPDGVIIGPTFRKEALELCADLERKGIPYVFVDADIEGTKPVASYTVDQHACGAFLGRLVADSSLDHKEVILFRSGRKGCERSNNTLAREEGLQEYLRSRGCGTTLIQTVIPSNDEAEALILSTLSAHPGVRIVLVLNSRGHVVADVLRRNGRQDIALLGFDMTPQNRRGILDGSITLLLCQRPEQQGFSALKRLISAVLYRGKSDPERYLLPIDVVIKENLPYYREVLEG